MGLHPDFGSGLYNGSDIGIPYVVVGSSQPPVNINFTATAMRAIPDRCPCPRTLPSRAIPIPAATATCWCSTTPTAGCMTSTARIRIRMEAGTPAWRRCGTCWLTSNVRGHGLLADAAGLPIFPGLARYDEVASGQIRHALRFTLAQSRAAFVPPASH
jgi:hypothetical protein